MNGPRALQRGNDYSTLQVIWFFLVVSVVIYLLVARFIAGASALREPGPVAVIAVALGVLSMALLGGQLFFRSFLSDERLFSRIRREMIPEAAPGSWEASALPRSIAYVAWDTTCGQENAAAMTTAVNAVTIRNAEMVRFCVAISLLLRSSVCLRSKVPGRNPTYSNRLACRVPMESGHENA